MLKKSSILFIFFLSFIFINSLSANSNKLRDELPELKKLTDLTIGTKRIKKGLKYEAKGKIEKANRMYSEAIDFLLKANKNQNIDSNIFFYLGFAYNKLDDFEKAKIYYQLGLVIDPMHPSINKFLGELYINSKKFELANERLEVLKNCNCEEYLDLKRSVTKK